MNSLTERQRLILALVIHTYTETAQPVGSMALIERYNLETSSATIRNDMVELTEAGYLRQPYTSAGRAPTEEGYRYFVRHLSLISTQGRQVLMVMVWTGGQVRQQMLTLAEPVSQEQLSTAASHINQVCEGLDADGIAALSGQFDVLEQDVIKLTSEELERRKPVVSGEVYRDGLTNVLAEPEFAESESARKA